MLIPITRKQKELAWLLEKVEHYVDSLAEKTKQLLLLGGFVSYETGKIYTNVQKLPRVMQPFSISRIVATIIGDKIYIYYCDMFEKIIFGDINYVMSKLKKGVVLESYSRYHNESRNILIAKGYKIEFTCSFYGFNDALCGDPIDREIKLGIFRTLNEYYNKIKPSVLPAFQRLQDDEILSLYEELREERELKEIEILEQEILELEEKLGDELHGEIELNEIEALEAEIEALEEYLWLDKIEYVKNEPMLLYLYFKNTNNKSPIQPIPQFGCERTYMSYITRNIAGWDLEHQLLFYNRASNPESVTQHIKDRLKMFVHISDAGKLFYLIREHVNRSVFMRVIFPEVLRLIQDYPIVRAYKNYLLFDWDIVGYVAGNEPKFNLDWSFEINSKILLEFHTMTQDKRYEEHYFGCLRENWLPLLEDHVPSDIAETIFQFTNYFYSLSHFDYKLDQKNITKKISVEN